MYRDVTGGPTPHLASIPVYRQLDLRLASKPNRVD